MAENDKENSEDEKLSKEEFRQLIPHLEFNHLFLIEIKRSGSWQNLFVPQYENDELKKITCKACLDDLSLEEFEQHIHLSAHVTALKQVEEFYHPLFTSDRQNSASQEENLEATEEIKQRNLEQANAIAAKIKNIKRSNSCKKEFSAEMDLSLENLMAVEYKIGGKWRPLIKTRGPPRPKGKFDCAVCSRYCVGAISLNAHLKGASHRNLQVKTQAVRMPKDERLTKYSILGCSDIRYDEEESNSNSKPKVSTKSSHDVSKEVEEKSKEIISEKKTLKYGLIGVEYVAKLKSTSNPETFLYACCLCDSEIMVTAEMMEKHLKSFSHRQTYCELHFSDTMKNYKRMISDCRAQPKIVMPFVLEKIALGIDQYHGYGTPTTFTEMEFRKDKKKVSERLHGLPHACQEFGPSFSNVLTSQEMRDFNKTPFEEVDSGSDNDPVRFLIRNPKKFYLNLRRHVSRPIDKRSNKLESIPSERREKSFDKRTRSPSPEYVSRKRRDTSKQKENNRSADIWSVYRDQISKAAIELENLYVGYRKHPEKHPSYEQEWNTFWRRRKEELVLEGKYHRSYNFQPEWTTYFRQRLEKMFGEDLQKSKIDVRHRLNIPIDAEEDSFLAPEYQSNNLPVTQVHSENVYNSISTGEQLKSAFASENNKKPTVIHMLRLMTALEDHLGSLGTKILDLLTKALSLEKFYSPDSEVLEKKILTAENCKHLKIAIEKLKSKLYADLIEGNKVNSFKRVIECTELILKKAETMGWTNDVDFAVDDNLNNPIDKLIEVLQKKEAVSSPMSKTSLSDALMEVISKKKINETQNCFEPSMEQMNMTKINRFPNNLATNINPRMQKANYGYFPPNIQSGPINTNANITRSHGGSNMQYNNQYGNHLFGNTNMQFPNSNPQYNFAHPNYGSNSNFMHKYPNVPNNRGYWKQ